MKRRIAPRSASSGATESLRARFARAKKASPSSCSISARSPAAMAASSSRSSSSTFARGPGHVSRHALEHALPAPLGLLLLLLQRRPLLQHAFRVLHLRGAEHVGMARDELAGDRLGDVLEGELPRLLRELRLEDDLEEQVAQLLAVLAGIAGVDGLEDLVRLLEHVRA